MKISKKIVLAVLTVGISIGGLSTQSKAFAFEKDINAQIMTTMYNEKGNLNSVKFELIGDDDRFNNRNLKDYVKYSKNLIYNNGVCYTKAYSGALNSINTIKHFYLDVNINYNDKEYSKLAKEALNKGIPNNFAVVDYGFAFNDKSKSGETKYFKVIDTELIQASKKEESLIKSFIKEANNKTFREMKISIRKDSVDINKKSINEKVKDISVELSNGYKIDKNKINTILDITRDVSNPVIKTSYSCGFKAGKSDKVISIFNSRNECIAHYLINRKGLAETEHTFYDDKSSKTFKATISDSKFK